MRDEVLRAATHGRQKATGAGVRATLAGAAKELAAIRAEAAAIEAESFSSDDEHARFWATRSKRLLDALALAQRFLVKAKAIVDEMDEMKAAEEAKAIVEEMDETE